LPSPKNLAISEKGDYIFRHHENLGDLAGQGNYRERCSSMMWRFDLLADNAAIG